MEPVWGSTNVTSKLDECSSSKERAVALEKTYVHEVYQQIACHFTDSRYRAWPRVKQFLVDLEPGSTVCDVGCGNGKYLSFNPYICKIGLDRCSNLATATRERGHEVLISDNLSLPLRDECFDAVLSIAVIHHFATTDRRVQALKELARVLRIGGRLMVSVWAMEQRHRKFESQDVLVPWNRPVMSSSDDKTSSIERDLNSTTTTSDDDATHYHAYTQTSDSDSFPSLSREFRKRARVKHRVRSIDPTCPSSSHSSSDLSSPNESCYTFVRRALQKLAGTKRNRGGRRPWFLQGLDIPYQDELIEPLASMDEDADGDNRKNLGDELLPGELRPDFMSSEFAELMRLQEGQKNTPRSMLFSSILSPRRRRTLETTGEIQHSSHGHIAAQPKSKSLSDLFGLIPIGLLRPRKSPEPVKKERIATRQNSGAHSSLTRLELGYSHDEVDFPDFVRHKAVQTDSLESLEMSIDGSPSRSITNAGYLKTEFTLSPEPVGRTLRPALVKQKQSIGSPSPVQGPSFEGTQEEKQDRSPEIPASSLHAQDEASDFCWGEIKTSVRNLPEFKSAAITKQPSAIKAAMAGSSFWKQTSLNEELIFSERAREKERLKQHIQKQCSLNEELIYQSRENTRWDQMKEAFLNPSNVKCIQLLRNNLSSRFRGTTTDTSSSSEVSPSPTSSPNSRQPAHATTTSLKNGLVRMLQNWKQGDGSDSSVSSSVQNIGGGSAFLSSRRGSKDGTSRRGLFPPFFLRRSSAGSLSVNKKDMVEHTALKVLSPPPYLSRRPSESELSHDGRLVGGNGSKLIPGVRHVRKLSREDGSDSSKDSSFQSDTSVDSEDSFASVIFIPKASDVAGNEFAFNSETRANSTDSDRSPKSPASRLSPPNHSSTPKSPSPLASELIRRRSPEVSPTRFGFLGTATVEKDSKFLFDESATQNLSSGPASSSSAGTGVIVSVTEIPDATLVIEPGHIAIQPLSLVPEVPELEIVPEVELEAAPVLPPQPPKKVEKIEVLRKAVNFPQNKAEVTRRLVRRSLPKALAVELFNPETDDADTSDSSSSSPNSVSSVVSVVNEDSSAANLISQEEKKRIETELSQELEGTESKELPKTESRVSAIGDATKSCVSQSSLDSNKSIELPTIESEETGQRTGRGILESATQIGTSLESDSSQSSSSPKSRRKLTLARLGSTSDWLSSLPCDMVAGTGSQTSKRTSIDRRHPGEKILLGEVKKFQQKGPDAKWPNCITDESPPQTASKLVEEESPLAAMIIPSAEVSSSAQSSSELAAKLLEEMEEKDSLFDSIENLASKQHPSRNPSIDSSIRMSSTCSGCGGDSFDSWTSAKSSLTNSSSTHHKNSLPSSTIPVPVQPRKLVGGCSRRRRPDSSKSSSAAGEDPEDPTSLTYHRYYHVFREGELDKLIEKYVQNLHIISSYYDHASWCIVAEKVQVWTI